MAGRQIIFTDLDGTLIDFETYSPDCAMGTVQRLLDQGVSIVFCSSKTMAEQKALMSCFGCEFPAIVENGGGMYLPGVGLQRLGDDAGRIRSLLRRAERSMGIELGLYCDIGPRQLMQCTGLSFTQATDAIDRQFSETFTAVLSADDHVRLKTLLNSWGLDYQCGGRFHTVTSLGVDKGAAMRHYISLLRERYPKHSYTVHAIGDGPNDAAMLLTADCAWQVQKPDKTWTNLGVDIPGLNKVQAAGPQGWVMAFESISEPAAGEDSKILQQQ